MSTAITSFASLIESNSILKGKSLKEGVYFLSAEFILEKNKPAVIVGDNVLLTSPVQYWELIEDVENTWGILVTLNSIYKVVLK